MKEATLSTVVSAPIKDAVGRFCRARGIKVRHFVEQALIEQLEDEIDLAEYENRRDEERVSLKAILDERRRKAGR